MLKLSLAKLDDLFAAISADRALYLPVDDASGQAKYQKWTEGAKLSQALNTVRSAKDFFFPQTENLVDFKVKGKEIEIIDPRTEHDDFVIFGVRACDARSFSILDKVFLADPVDTYYQSRREHGIVVSMACTRPEETCFCTSFGMAYNLFWNRKISLKLIMPWVRITSWTHRPCSCSNSLSVASVSCAMRCIIMDISTDILNSSLPSRSPSAPNEPSNVADSVTGRYEPSCSASR